MSDAVNKSVVIDLCSHDEESSSDEKPAASKKHKSSDDYPSSDEEITFLREVIVISSDDEEDPSKKKAPSYSASPRSNLKVRGKPAAASNNKKKAADALGAMTKRAANKTANAGTKKNTSAKRRTSAKKDVTSDVLGVMTKRAANKTANASTQNNTNTKRRTAAKKDQASDALGAMTKRAANKNANAGTKKNTNTKRRTAAKKDQAKNIKEEKVDCTLVKLDPSLTCNNPANQRLHYDFARHINDWIDTIVESSMFNTRQYRGKVDVMKGFSLSISATSATLDTVGKVKKHVSGLGPKYTTLFEVYFHHGRFIDTSLNIKD